MIYPHGGGRGKKDVSGARNDLGVKSFSAAMLSQARDCAQVGAGTS
jgi:hypothetical protein